MVGRGIRRFGVIGAGNMGSGIAQKVATEGHEVVLVDLDRAGVERGLASIRATLGEGVTRRIFRPEEAEAILGRVTGTTDWERLEDVDLVIEAVFEDITVKRDVFGRLGRVCRPDALLATNTSSFRVADVAASTPQPERVLGLHYFYHPAKNRLVEVVGHEGSDPAALAAAWAAQEAIGKTPIASADAPGFVVTRFFVPWLNEAVRLLEEGVADIPTIEVAAKRAFQIGMGPFELMNVTGVPIALHAATNLGREIHPFYAPAGALAAQVESGEPWDLSGEAGDSGAQAVADRLLGVVLHIAARLVEEGVASVEDTDLGARIGLRWSKGPFQLANELGLARAAALADGAMAGQGFGTPPLLAGAGGDPIPIEVVGVAIRGSLAGITVRRPDALNALNGEVVAQLTARVAKARSLGTAGLVVGGQGKAFVAGADIKFFVDCIRAGVVGDIRAFTAEGAALFGSLSGGESPTIARVHGLSLGGGSELALACDWIAAGPKATFGFPETGLGIYPGLGGTQRLPRRIGVPLAKWLVLTGEVLGAEDALALGLCDGVAELGELDALCESLAGRGPVTGRDAPSAPADPAWQPIWDLFERSTVQEILAGEADTGGDPRLERAVKRMGHKSPAALRIAEALIDQGADLPLEEALALELLRLEEVFGHPDALEGLSALIEGRRPAFAAM